VVSIVATAAIEEEKRAMKELRDGSERRRAIAESTLRLALFSQTLGTDHCEFGSDQTINCGFGLETLERLWFASPPIAADDAAVAVETVNEMITRNCGLARFQPEDTLAHWLGRGCFEDLHYRFEFPQTRIPARGYTLTGENDPKFYTDVILLSVQTIKIAALLQFAFAADATNQFPASKTMAAHLWIQARPLLAQAMFLCSQRLVSNIANAAAAVSRGFFAAGEDLKLTTATPPPIKLAHDIYEGSDGDDGLGRRLHEAAYQLKRAIQTDAPDTSDAEIPLQA